jgi:hypothetical protein
MDRLIGCWEGWKVSGKEGTSCIISGGGVGERLKPAVLKNKIADSLSIRKFN